MPQRRDFGLGMAKADFETYQGMVKAAAARQFEQLIGVGAMDLAGRMFHFIGAGGIGMSGLAQLLIKNKAVVSGSDQCPGDIVAHLREIGADVRIGHDAANLSPETDAVVISAAIREDNPELSLARRRGCKVYKYAELLGAVSSRYDCIAVSGTHGKSTTSAWVGFCLDRAGLEPSFIIGADVPQLGGSSGVGDGDYFVAEACEYDRSFLNLRPKIAAILNIEQDHLDYYRDEDEIVEAFSQFAMGTRSDGVVVANGADRNVAKVIESIGRDLPLATFGIAGDYDFTACNVRVNGGLYSFEVYHNGEKLGATAISLPGEHNVLNALAVVAMAVNSGLDPERVLELLSGFTGIDRRLMLKGRVGEITVMDDYAHHPTEIRASLQAIRLRYEPRRLWCVFQPHQYSRTRFLLDDFAESFKLADVTIVPEIYFVRDSESSRKAINSQMLVERIRSNGTEALFIDGFGAICEYLKENVAEGDLMVTMGAGDIWKVADDYIQWLGRNS